MSIRAAVPLPPVDQQSCGNCAAFRADPSQGDGGYCHLNPPTMIAQIPIGGATYSDPKPFWTEVKGTDWCYQWGPMP